MIATNETFTIEITNETIAQVNAAYSTDQYKPVHFNIELGTFKLCIVDIPMNILAADKGMEYVGLLRLRPAKVEHLTALHHLHPHKFNESPGIVAPGTIVEFPRNCFSEFECYNPHESEFDQHYRINGMWHSVPRLDPAWGCSTLSEAFLPPISHRWTKRTSRWLCIVQQA